MAQAGDLGPPNLGSLNKAGWAYALVPVVGALLWLATGDLDDERNRSPLELTQFAELALVFIAIRAGLDRRFLAAGLDRAQAIALGLVALSFLAALVTAAPEPLAALERAAMRVPHLGAAIAVCFLLARAGRETAGGFARFILLQPLLHVPILLLMMLLYVDEPRMNWLGGPVGFWHVRVWGSVLAAAIAAAIGLHASIWPAGRRSDLVLFGALLALFTLLAWSGSRASMLGLGLSWLVALAIFRGRLWRSAPIVVVAAVLGVALSLLLVVPHPSYGLVNTLAESTGTELDASTGGRMTLWRGTLELIAERPFFGHGFDQFRYVYTGMPEGTIQPHNAPLQLLADFGLIGGLAAMFLLLSFWWRAVRGSTTEAGRWKIGPVMVLNAMVVISLFDGALYHAEPLAIISIAFGILLSGPRDA